MKLLLTYIFVLFSIIFTQENSSKEDLIKENQKLRSENEELKVENEKFQKKIKATGLLKKEDVKLSILEEIALLKKELETTKKQLRKEIEAARRVIRTTYIQSEKANSVDNGEIPGRKFKFEKLKPTTVLKVIVSDNFRIRKGRAAWKIAINGQVYIHKTIFHGEDYDIYRPGVIMGYIHNLPKGEHVFSLLIHGSTDSAYTGWESKYMVEIQEIQADHLVGVMVK